MPREDAFLLRNHSLSQGETSCGAHHAASYFVTRLCWVTAHMWTIPVPAANSSSGIRPSPYAPLRCCPSVHPTRASTPLCSTLMLVCRFRNHPLQHYYVPWVQDGCARKPRPPD